MFVKYFSNRHSPTKHFFLLNFHRSSDCLLNAQCMAEKSRQSSRRLINNFITTAERSFCWWKSNKHSKIKSRVWSNSLGRNLENNSRSGSLFNDIVVLSPPILHQHLTYFVDWRRTQFNSLFRPSEMSQAPTWCLICLRMLSPDLFSHHNRKTKTQITLMEFGTRFRLNTNFPFNFQFHFFKVHQLLFA